MVSESSSSSDDEDKKSSGSSSEQSSDEGTSNSHEMEEELKEIKPKSKRGGRRPGAGRRPKPVVLDDTEMLSGDELPTRRGGNSRGTGVGRGRGRGRGSNTRKLSDDAALGNDDEVHGKGRRGSR